MMARNERKVAIYATKSFSHEGRAVTPGEILRLTPVQAIALQRAGRGSFTRPMARKSSSAEAKPTQPKGAYMRRDMVAETPAYTRRDMVAETPVEPPPPAPPRSPMREVHTPEDPTPESIPEKAPDTETVEIGEPTTSESEQPASEPDAAEGEDSSTPRRRRRAASKA
jgi:hypothetical protein